MMTQIKLILAAVALSALIWVYADLTSHDTRRVQLLIELAVPPNSDTRIQLEGSSEPPDRAVMTEVVAGLTGTKAAMGTLDAERQRTNGQSLKILVPVLEPTDKETMHSENLREHITEWARRHSLQVLDLSRQTVTYRLDRVVTIEIGVEADPGLFTEELTEPPEVDPPKVKAEVLASRLAEGVLTDRRLVIPIEEQLRRRPDETVVFEESLSQRWPQLDVRFIPDRVIITVMRRQSFRRQRLTAIPLQEMWPSYRPEGQYRVVWENDDAPPVLHIDVLVPASKPRPLTNKDVTAFVRIDREDLPADNTGTAATAPAIERASIPREVRFVFEPGFEDVRVVPPVPKVRLKVVRVEPVAVHR